MQIRPQFARYIQMIGPYDGNRRGPESLNGDTFQLAADVSHWKMHDAARHMGMRSSRRWARRGGKQQLHLSVGSWILCLLLHGARRAGFDASEPEQALKT